MRSVIPKSEQERRDEMIIPLIGAGIATTALLYFALSPAGKNVVMWYDGVRESAPNDRGTFRQAARSAAGALRATAVPIESGADIADAIRSFQGKISVLVLVGHGTPTSFFEPNGAGLRVGPTSLPGWLGIVDFARLLAPKLKRGFVISLAGCSAARENSEHDEGTWWDGGTRSLAGMLRDALALAGAPSGEVRGHTSRGTVLLNPQGRTFYVKRAYAGRPGIHVMKQAGRAQPRSLNDVVTWNNYARGNIAARWMLGAPVPRG